MEARQGPVLEVHFIIFLLIVVVVVHKDKAILTLFLMSSTL